MNSAIILRDKLKDLDKEFKISSTLFKRFKTLQRTLSTLREGCISLIFPPHCELCEKSLPQGNWPVCAECLEDFELTGDDYCNRCGSPLGQHVGVLYGCKHCEQRPQGFGVQQIVAVGHYQNKLRELILKLKYQRRRILAEVAALWLVQLVLDRGIEIDLVTAIPLSSARTWQRGFNQAEAIASKFAQELNLPFENQLLKRIKESPLPQAQLSKSAREANIRGAFQPGSQAQRAQKKRILIVDDVLTTGATLYEATRTLKKAKPKQLYGAVIARSFE